MVKIYCFVGGGGGEEEDILLYKNKDLNASQLVFTNLPMKREREGDRQTDRER